MSVLLRPPQVDETRAAQFRAMMTDERAGQHLMQLTLGDSVLINSTNDAEQILDQLESRFEEKHKSIADERIALVEAQAAAKLREAEGDQERHRQIALDASMNEILARGELDVARRQAEVDQRDWEIKAKEREIEGSKRDKELTQLYIDERNARVDEKLSLIRRCVDKARDREVKSGYVLTVVIALLVWLSVYLGTEYMTAVSAKNALYGAFLAAVLAAVSFWNNPQLLFGWVIRDARDKKFRSLIDEYQLESYVGLFEINWEDGSVKRTSVLAENKSTSI